MVLKCGDPLIDHAGQILHTKGLCLCIPGWPPLVCASVLGMPSLGNSVSLQCHVQNIILASSISGSSGDDQE